LINEFPSESNSYKALTFLERYSNYAKIERCEGFPKLPEKEINDKEEGKFMKK